MQNSVHHQTGKRVMVCRTLFTIYRLIQPITKCQQMCKPTVVQWSNQSPDPQTTATTKQHQRQYPEPNFAFDFMPRCDLPREYYSGEWSLVPSPVNAVFLRLTHFAEEFRSGPGWWEWKTSPEIPPFDLYFHVAASFAVDWLTQRVTNNFLKRQTYIASMKNEKFT